MAKQKTILVRRYGGPEVLEITERPVPIPNPDEVRIKVLAAGVAFGDIQLRKGVSWQSLMTKLPLVPGYDFQHRAEGVAKIHARIQGLAYVEQQREFADFLGHVALVLCACGHRFFICHRIPLMPCLSREKLQKCKIGP